MRNKSIFESIWFDTILLIVSVIIIGEKLYTFLYGEVITKDYIITFIWLVITIHFLLRVIKFIKKK
jgi:hypothetical protein